MFEKSILVANQIKQQKNQDSKTLSLVDRIAIAESCLQKTNDREEYKEISKIKSDLVEELKLERKGLYSPTTHLSEENAAGVLKTVNGELKKAEAEYKKLLKEADSVRNKYLSEIEPVLRGLTEIEWKYRYIKSLVNEGLPDGLRVNFVDIPSDHRLSEAYFLTQLNKPIAKRRLDK